MHRPFLLIAAAVLAASHLTSCQSPGTARSGPTGKNFSPGSALQSAQRAWTALPASRPASTEQDQSYTAAMGSLLTSLRSARPLATWTGTQSIEGWQVTFASPGQPLQTIDPATCTDISPSPALSERDSRQLPPVGSGLPVIMKQEYDGRKAASHKLFPLNGRNLPATMTAEFTGPQAVTITFHNTWTHSMATVRGAKRPLATDYRNPIRRSMDPKFLGEFSLKGLLHPDDTLNDAGLYVPFIYDPAKIPVVFVHGLNSDPHIWEQAMHEIASDPALRDRYQPWYFLYPTGLPIHGSAARLRRALTGAIRHYDPHGKSAAMQQMVLVGHSMGGIISRLQVTDSEEEIYHAYFQRDIDKLFASADAKRQIRENLFFEPNPRVARVVFVAVPHRGSGLADLRIVQWLTGLIQRAVRVDQFITDIARTATSTLNPQLIAFKDLGARSVQNLSPRHPLLLAMDRRPVEVPFHSIIGVKQSGKPLPETSDGVVPYTSAHLDGAVSEHRVPATHSCTDHPEVTAEIRRILRQHAGIR
jgi:pimeloyl-ACP methyl ester carboxylesterase